MTYEECEIKAKEALAQGLINYEQLESYIKHLYEKYGKQ